MAIRDDEMFAPFGRLADEARDRPGESAGVRARAVELLESEDPIQFSVGRKQRLLLSLGHGSVKQQPLMWLRPVVVGVILLGAGAVASAALTGWPSRLVRSLETRVSPKVDAPSIPRPPRVRTEPTTLPTVVIDSNPATTPPPVSPVRRAAVEARPRRQVQVEPASDDSAMLVVATRALRIDRDPVLARALAKRYLDRQPRGALVDEALAISIEAAIDHHDPDAAALSARYLAQFPHGSFRALAERTLGSQPR